MMPTLSLRLISLTLITLQRQLIHEITAGRDRWLTSYDFVVVGAGTAGSIVGHRLAASGRHRVLLLEAGGALNAVFNDIPGMRFAVLNQPSLNWPFVNVPQANAGLAFRGPLSDEMGKGLGGSSSHNGGHYGRGSRHDYDNFAQTYGADGWSYADILPLYIKAENNTDLALVRNNPGYHGTQGLLPVVSVEGRVDPILQLLTGQFHALGFGTVDENGRSQIGTLIVQKTKRDGLRCGTACAYIDPNPYPNTLHIVAKAHVSRVLFITRKGMLTASGVEFVRNGRTYRVTAEKEVILSAGVMNSPQILILSGIGPKEHLTSLGIPVLIDLPVGLNFANHVRVTIYATLRGEGFVNTAAELNVNQLSELYYNKTGPLAEWPVSLYTYISSAGNPRKDWSNAHLLGIAFKGYSLNSSAVNITSTDTLTMGTVLSRPKSKGTIRLASKDPFTYPLIDPQFLTHPQDMADTVDALKLWYYIYEATPFAQYVKLTAPIPQCQLCGDRPIHGCDDYLRCYAKQMSEADIHPSGSCRMGARNRTDVVVDQRCRVRHVLGLRVADTSIYPETPNSGSYAPAVLVGEKCSQMIIEDWDV